MVKFENNEEILGENFNVTLAEMFSNGYVSESLLNDHLVENLRKSELFSIPQKFINTRANCTSRLQENRGYIFVDTFMHRLY